jgi:hypothetical protein
MSGRWTGTLQSGIERLEGRGLLSVVAPPSSLRHVLSDGLHGPAVVEKSRVARSGSRSTAAGKGLDDSGHAARADEGSLGGAASEVRSVAGGVGSSRRSAFAAIPTRAMMDPLIVSPRLADTELTEAGAGVAGPDEAAVVDPSVTSSIVGWGPSGSTAAVVPLSEVIDRLAGRPPVGPGSPAPVLPSGSFGDTLPGDERGPGDAGHWANPGADGRDLVGMADEIGELKDSRSDRPGLLDGALDPDWESIDRELRRLLGGIARIVDHPDASGGGRAWLIGLAVALFYSWHRSSSGRRGLARRDARAAVDLRMTFDPWPVGPL